MTRTLSTEDVEIEGRRLRLTNLDRVLWPRAGLTKRRMLEYYRRIAPALLPHVAGRAITLRRFPEGVDGLNWYQSKCRGSPPWLPTVPIRTRAGEVHHHCVVNDLPSLLWVVNLGTIELHPFLALAGEADRPTAAVFDLDPGEPADVLDCARVALRVRGELEEVGLRSWVKTSGSAGLHVFVPLDGTATFARSKAFARSLAASLTERHPDEVVDRMGRALRSGRVLIDWSQNDPSKSTVAAYSLRGMAWPTVSTPVAWDEIERAVAAGRPELLTFEPDDALERVGGLGDLFSPLLRHRQVLPAERD